MSLIWPSITKLPYQFLQTTSLYHLITQLHLNASKTLLPAMSLTFIKVTVMVFIYNSDFTSFYLSEDIEFQWSHLSNLIRSAFKLFIPTFTAHKNNQPPWFDSDIRHNINCLRTLKRKHSVHPTEHNLNKLEYSQQQLHHKLSIAKSRYESYLIAGFACTKIMYLKIHHVLSITLTIHHLLILTLTK